MPRQTAENRPIETHNSKAWHLLNYKYKYIQNMFESIKSVTNLGVHCDHVTGE